MPVYRVPRLGPLAAAPRRRGGRARGRVVAAQRAHPRAAAGGHVARAARRQHRALGPVGEARRAAALDGGRARCRVGADPRAASAPPPTRPATERTRAARTRRRAATRAARAGRRRARRDAVLKSLEGSCAAALAGLVVVGGATASRSASSTLTRRRRSKREPDWSLGEYQRTHVELKDSREGVFRGFRRRRSGRRRRRAARDEDSARSGRAASGAPGRGATTTRASSNDADAMAAGAEARRPNRTKDAAIGISDFFVDGQWCDETNSPRTSRVDFRCCSDGGEAKRGRAAQPTTTRASRGAAAKHGGAGAIGGGKDAGGGVVAQPMAQLASIHERSLCSYVVTICTPLLCGPNGGPHAANVSVATLLEPLRSVCLQRHEGWWSYEFCYARHVRQFHVGTTTDKKGKAQSRVEAEFVLGKHAGTAADKARRGRVVVVARRLARRRRRRGRRGAAHRQARRERPQRRALRARVRARHEVRPLGPAARDERAAALRRRGRDRLGRRGPHVPLPARRHDAAPVQAPDVRAQRAVGDHRHVQAAAVRRRSARRCVGRGIPFFGVGFTRAHGWGGGGGCDICLSFPVRCLLSHGPHHAHAPTARPHTYTHQSPLRTGIAQHRGSSRRELGPSTVTGLSSGNKNNS